MGQQLLLLYNHSDPNYPMLTFYIIENGLFVSSWRSKMGGGVVNLKVCANTLFAHINLNCSHYSPKNSKLIAFCVSQYYVKFRPHCDHFGNLLNFFFIFALHFTHLSSQRKTCTTVGCFITFSLGHFKLSNQTICDLCLGPSFMIP